MEFTEKLGCPDGIVTAGMLLCPLGLPPKEVYKEDRLPWMEQDCNQDTAAMDGKCICNRYCSSSFYNYIRVRSL
jgi:hypothetical protein